jgi:spore coat polysaccharide biosynthesis protein SpsF (cytidylyltransferase family)
MAGTVVVLQARLGSRRLPGKVLARINGRTILEHCIARLLPSGVPVVVATTTRPEDDRIEREARRHGAEVFRGDESDVLARVIGAARAFGASEIVRATADNPLVDIGAPARVLDLRRRVQADHVVECGLPVGAAVEAASLGALVRAQALITDPYDREHVTSFLRRAPGFLALRAVSPGNVRRPGLRLTVDTAEDLEFVRNIMARFPADVLPDLAQVLTVADGLLVRSVARQRTQQGA